MVCSGGRRGVAAAGLLLLLALAGCGEDSPAATDATDGSTASSAPASGETAPPGTPDCGEVWQDGERLARSYKGCAEPDGHYVAKDALSCSSGQWMVVYADRYYGVLGGTVHEADGSLEQDRDYRTAVRSCRA